MHNLKSTPILIVGAGPTGLVLALSLARRGVAFRIIDEHDGPGTESRAMGVQARTLEFYAQFGFADEVVSQGIPADKVHLRHHGHDNKDHESAIFRLKNMGEGLTPFPFMLTYPQDVHERFLESKLADLGIAIERNTTLSALSQDANGVRATVQNGGESETILSDTSWAATARGAVSAKNFSSDSPAAPTSSSST